MSRTEPVVRASESPVRVAILMGLLFGLSSMGTSSAAVVLPNVAAELDVSLATSTWTITAYVLVLAVTTAVYGRVSDMVGARAPLLFGIGLMTSGALAAAIAPSFSVLVVARIFQGAGAAAIPTLGAAVLSARYEGQVRGLALGRLAAISAALTCVGPLLGGLVEAALGWRAVMALPILGALVLPFIWRTLAGGGSGARLDVWGAVLVAFTSAGLVLVVQSPATGLALTGFGGLVLLVSVPLVLRRINTHPHGFLPKAVMRNGTVIRSALAAAPVPACWFVMLIGVPVVLVDDGWQPWAVGLLLAPSAAVALLVPRWSASLLVRRGGIWVMLLAMVLASVSMVISGLALLLGQPSPIVLAIVIMAVAFGLGHPAVLATVGESTDLEVRGVALGVVSLLFLLGGSVGSALVAGLGSLIGVPATVLVSALLPMLAILVLRPEFRRARVAGPA